MSMSADVKPELKYTPEYVQSEVRRAKEEYGVAYFPGIFTEVPEWADFIENIQINRQKVTDFAPHGDVETFLGKVIKRNDADFYFYTGGGEGGNLGPITEKVERTLREDYGLGEILSNGGPRSTGTFVNFAVEGFNVPLHGDDRDTLFWQCIGKTRWTLYSPLLADIEDREHGVEEESHHLLTVELEPGDLIYIGHRVRHAVEIIEPRAGIAFKGTF
jgi:hypothetical protein